MLQGKSDVALEEEDEKPAHTSPSKCKSPQVKGGNDAKRKREPVENKRLEGLAGAEIKAFLDIGHGLGIQVLQAGWSLGVPSRGVEIMRDRHLISEQIRKGVLDSCERPAPDSRMAELRLADFSCAIVPEKNESEEQQKERKELLSFLLFEDKPEVQNGFVIFVNNAEEVFSSRSNQRNTSDCLDAYLARLFANMQVGGRMVTLTDVSPHLASSGWFRYDQVGTYRQKLFAFHTAQRTQCECYSFPDRLPLYLQFPSFNLAQTQCRGIGEVPSQSTSSQS